MRQFDETPVNALTAREILGWSKGYMYAVKRAMGIKNRYFFLSDVRKFVRNNPKFTPVQMNRSGNGDLSEGVESIGGQKPASSNTEHLNPSSSMSINLKPNRSSADQSMAYYTIKSESPMIQIEDKNTKRSRSSTLTGELGYRLRSLRGSLSVDAVARKAGLSRESVRRIERGDTVKMATLRRIAGCLRATREQWLGLLVSWLKLEVGEDAGDLRIEPKANEESHDPISEQIALATKYFERLDPAEREEMVFAMQRKEVIPCLTAINDAVRRASTG